MALLAILVFSVACAAELPATMHGEWITQIKGAWPTVLNFASFDLTADGIAIALPTSLPVPEALAFAFPGMENITIIDDTPIKPYPSVGPDTTTVKGIMSVKENMALACDYELSYFVSPGYTTAEMTFNFGLNSIAALCSSAGITTFSSFAIPSKHEPCATDEEVCGDGSTAAATWDTLCVRPACPIACADRVACSQYGSVTPDYDTTCIDAKCVCQQHYSGDDCSVAGQCPSDFIACENGAQVQGNMGDCYCACLDGFHGDLCEIENNNYRACQLTDIQCVNGGQPRGILDQDALNLKDCSCFCPTGYEGDLCEIAPKCQSADKDCNGGLVTGRIGDCGCDCTNVKGYDGDECKTAKPCVAGEDAPFGLSCVNGTIAGTTGTCKCACDAGYSGTLCDVADPCVLDGPAPTGLKCANGGKIGGTTGACTCTCEPGYDGKLCDIALPCEDRFEPPRGLKCNLKFGAINGTTGNCFCTCQKGYGGILGLCNDPLPCTDEDITCENKGSPKGKFGDCSCECLGGYKGNTCDKKISSGNAVTFPSAVLAIVLSWMVFVL